jgi:hypothetical protein
MGRAPRLEGPSRIFCHAADDKGSRDFLRPACSAATPKRSQLARLVARTRYSRWPADCRPDPILIGNPTRSNTSGGFMCDVTRRPFGSPSVTRPIRLRCKNRVADRLSLGPLLSEKAAHQSSIGSMAKCYARCGDSPHCFRAKDPPTPNGYTNEDVLFEYNSSCATG